MSVTKYTQKCPRNHTMNKKKIKCWEKNGFTFKLKHRKAQKSIIFIWEIWWPVRERGRSVPYPGDSRTIRERWHNYALYENDCVKTGVTTYLWWTFYQWRVPKGNSAFKCTTGNASVELNVYNNNNLYTCTCIPSVTALAMRLCLLTIRLSSYREGEIQGWFLLQILLFKNKTVL